MKGCTTLIAEIGINHDGCNDKAIQLVEAAVDAGFDAVKFQVRDPELSTPAHMKQLRRHTIWGELSYLEYRKRIELDWTFYEQMASGLPTNVEWIASAWDRNSIGFLKKSTCSAIKVPSAYANSYQFVEACRATGKKLIVSTGGLQLADVIANANNMYHRAWIAHCISLYPPQLQDLNLSWISYLRSKLPNHRVGFSCHIPNIDTLICAVAAGSTFIEVHITHHRNSVGSDHAISFEAHELRGLVQRIREAELMLGSIGVFSSKASQQAKLRTLYVDIA